MDDAFFWDLISKLDWEQEGDDAAVVEPVVAALAERPEAEITEFGALLASKLFALDGRAWARESGDVIWWGEPASLSVDGFLFARCVVVANGCSFYEAVVRDPAKMPKDMEFEALISVAPLAYARRTGREADDLNSGEVSFETFSNHAGWNLES
ncbi:MAG: DUF4240 domain-containing protein [Actinomycetota bacterium]|nr:DUF4240 domain-containing protein [Actinomycetota bacterium]